MNWNQLEFKDLYLIPSRNGLTKPGKVRGEGFKFINMGELFAYNRLQNPEMELTPLTEKEKISHKIEIDDLLFARQSIVLSGAGKCSIVKKVDNLTVFDSHIIRVRLNEELCIPDFYYYYFRTSYSNVKSLVLQGVQAGIRGKELAKLKIVCPPLQTQKRIADILSAYDDLIENNLKRIKLLEQAAQNIYKEWFVNLRFPGYENTTINKETGLPKGWEEKTFDKTLDFKTGKLNSNAAVEGGKYPFFTCSQEIFKTNTFSFDTEAVLLGGNNASANYPLKYFKGKFDAYQRTYIIKPKSAISHVYVYLVLLDRLYFLKQISTGAATKFLTMRILNQLKILIPGNQINAHFTKVVSPFFEQIALLNKSNEKLKAARDILLPRLMNRTIEV
jgi:type I restriction enzyme S subunit